MKNNTISVAFNDITAPYGSQVYRIQKNRGNEYIRVNDAGERRKITVKRRPFLVVDFYVLSGLFFRHPCNAMQYWVDLTMKKTPVKTGVGLPKLSNCYSSMKMLAVQI